MLYKIPLVAIRAKCLDCCVGQAKEVRLCTVIDCPLYSFRFGENPFTRRKGNKRNFFINDSPSVRNHSQEETVKKSLDRELIFSKETIRREV